MELGVYTFGDLTPDPETGRTVTTGDRYLSVKSPSSAVGGEGLSAAGTRRTAESGVALEPV